MRLSELAAVLLIFIVIAFIYGEELLFLIFRILGGKKNKPKAFFNSKYFWIIHILAIIGIGCFIDGFFIEPNWIEVNRIEIETTKLKNTSFRIVQFSDIHCDTKQKNEQKLVEIVNSLNPDVIVFTGDSFNSPEALLLFKDTLGRMKANLGKFAVRGNFDSYFWNNINLFSGTGFEELKSDTERLEKIGDVICMAGFNVRYPDNFKTILRRLSADNYNVLLYHYSDLAESLGDLNVDLYLSGHTHGGQGRLPFYGAPVTLSHFGKKYESGMYNIGKMKLYVNRGIGFKNKPAPKVRFLCRPEITVFDIKPAGHSKKK